MLTNSVQPCRCGAPAECSGVAGGEDISCTAKDCQEYVSVFGFGLDVVEVWNQGIRGDVIQLPRYRFCQDHGGDLPYVEKFLCDTCAREGINRCGCGSHARLAGGKWLGKWLSGIVCERCDQVLFIFGYCDDIEDRWNEGQRGYIRLPDDRYLRQREKALKEADLRWRRRLWKSIKSQNKKQIKFLLRMKKKDLQRYVVLRNAWCKYKKQILFGN